MGICKCPEIISSDEVRTGLTWTLKASGRFCENRLCPTKQNPCGSNESGRFCEKLSTFLWPSTAYNEQLLIGLNPGVVISDVTATRYMKNCLTSVFSFMQIILLLVRVVPRSVGVILGIIPCTVRIVPWSWVFVVRLSVGVVVPLSVGVVVPLSVGVVLFGIIPCTVTSVPRAVVPLSVGVVLFGIIPCTVSIVPRSWVFVVPLSVGIVVPLSVGVVVPLSVRAVVPLSVGVVLFGIIPCTVRIVPRSWIFVVPLSVRAVVPLSIGVVLFGIIPCTVSIVPGSVNWVRAAGRWLHHCSAMGRMCNNTKQSHYRKQRQFHFDSFRISTSRICICAACGQVFVPNVAI